MAFALWSGLFAVSDHTAAFVLVIAGLETTPPQSCLNSEIPLYPRCLQA